MGERTPVYYNFNQLGFLVATRGERLSILISGHVHPLLYHVKRFHWVLLHNFLPAFLFSVTHLALRGEPK